MEVAERVALEKKCELGTVVGYSVRFNEKWTKGTKIKYVTDGMLLREAISGRSIVVSISMMREDDFFPSHSPRLFCCCPNLFIQIAFSKTTRLCFSMKSTNALFKPMCCLVWSSRRRKREREPTSV